MSRSYQMFVRIRDFHTEHIDAIKGSAEHQWPFDDWSESDDQLTASADGNLCSGATEDEFAEELAREIWAANQGFCTVEVSATYLEDLPSEDYSFDEDDFQRLAGRRA